MKHFHLRRKAGALLFILAAAALLLASCRGGETGSPRKREAAAFLSSMKVSTAAGEGNLYDVSRLTEGEGTLCTYCLYDESKLLLLRCGSRDETGAAAGYKAELLDLCSGTVEELLSFDSAGILQEDSDGTQCLHILSADPLIVHDRSNRILYRPGTGQEAAVIPEWLGDASPYWFDGRLWLSSDRGILYEVTESGSLRAAWALPFTYGPLNPVITGHSGVLSFTTYSLSDPSSRIFVDVDPSGGESRFYLSDLSPAKFSSCSGNLLLGSSFRSAPKISVYDSGAQSRKVMELPGEIQSALNSRPLVEVPGEDSGFVAFQTVPLSVSGDWCTFMLCDSGERPVSIYLWDTDSCRSGKWSPSEEQDYAEPAETDYGAPSRAAAELASKYGVRIVIGSNIPREFADYAADAMEDPEVMEASLAVLDNALSLYPEGYFRALRGGYYRDVVFYLTGDMQPLNADSSISNAGAFATDANGLMQIAFNLWDDLRPATVIHELTHAADYRFAGEGLLDEEAWNAMNPEGFSYYYAYIDRNGESYETAGDPSGTAAGGCAAEDVYFIDPYSKTFPMEDRARLMENLLSGRSRYADCFRGAHMQEKLSFYFDFLRRTLDDGTWPPRTSWEEALIDARSSD